MSANPTPVQTAAKEIYDMLLRRSFFEATQLADEVAADAMREWQRNPSPTNTDDLMVAYCAMAEAQIASGRMREGLNTALRALATVSRDGDYTTAPHSRMMLCLTAWNALEQILTQAIPDEATRPAVAQAATALGNLLYRYYYATGRADAECPALQDAYDALRVITGLTRLIPDADPAETLRALVTSLSAARLAD